MSSASTAAPEAVETPALALVVTLLERLGGAGISYCHWKSNEAIARSASGDNDLDLLVSRADASAFAAILHDLGFRVARPTPTRQVPGILDYYGFDEGSGRVVHVHAHYQLALGDDMTKNLRLPIEDAYLASASLQGLFPLPAPELEYVVFVLRMVVKHSPLDAQLARKGRLTPSERRELAYLQARIDEGRLADVVAEHLPFLPPALFERCRSAVNEAVPRLRRAAVAHQLLSRLDDLGRRPGTADLIVRSWRRRRRKIEARLPGFSPRKRPDTGGTLIAVVGGDGAGKSSAVEALADLLSRDLVTRRVHMGKPRPSVLTRVVKRPVQRLRGNDPRHPTRLPAWATDGDAEFPGYLFMAWHLLTARDRYRTYVQARRAAARGEIVVSDRYPLPGLRLMDSARTSSVAGLSERPLARAIAARERWYYKRILPPDLLVVLAVDPDVAAARTSDEHDFALRRARELAELDVLSLRAVVIDANRPLDEVHAEVRNVVWKAL